MNTSRYALLLFLSFSSLCANAQYSFKAIFKDAENKQPLTGVVINDRRGKGAVSDENGKAVIDNLPAGKYTFYISYLGYKPDSVIAILPDAAEHKIDLHSTGKELEEVTVVASTRTNDRIENAPIKVEVIGKEDLEEENTIKPSNIASILGDVSGVQIQQTSVVSGDANIRIQGLGGQYTQLLRDGMPLFDGFSGGLSIMQIPPLDLKQVELIKGSASTLYGGGAIGGLVNLISKRPGDEQEAVLTLNQTSLGESDINTYFARRYHKIGYTFFASYAHQNAIDVNNDGFSDISQFNTVVVHPRLFLYPDDKTTITVGYEGTFENRLGGDMKVINGATDSVHQYYERNITQRNTGELIVERTLPGNAKLNIKGSASSYTRNIEASLYDLKANQFNYYSEASVFIPHKQNSFVGGINATGYNFSNLHSENIALGNYGTNTLGAFAQYTAHLPLNTTAEAGLRADHNDTYGNFILPRIALFHRFNETWATRAGIGFGYKTPDPLAQQLIDYPIEEIQPLPAGIKAERSVGYNIEGNYKKDFNDEANLFINQAFFLTQINSAVVATQAANGNVFFSNADKPIISRGSDTYLRLKINDIELYAGYTYTDVERKYLQTNQFMPLTPRNRIAFTALKEFDEKWRIGIEGSYYGQQYRDGDTKTPAYVLMALMLEHKFGKKITLVANAENLLNYKQSNVESIYTGPITDPTFKPLWAPIDGHVINLSLRYMPFAK